MLEAKLSNHRSRSARVPRGALDLEGGLLRVFVARGGAAPRRFRPLVEAWLRGGRRVLGAGRPGERLPEARYASVDLGLGRDGPPFGAIGHYTVYARASLPPHGEVESAALAIEIVPPAPGALGERILADPALGRALALGADPASEAAEGLRALAACAAGPGAAALAEARLGQAQASPWKRLGARAEPADPPRAAERFQRAAELAERSRALPNRAISAFHRGRLRARIRAGEPAAARDAEGDWERFIRDRVRENGALREALLRDVHAEATQRRRATSKGDP